MENSESQLSHRFEHFIMRLVSPLNSYAVRMGCEPFLAMPLEFECQKAARILRSFCLVPDGEPQPEPLVSIPQSAIAQAVGLAIFTTGRIGFHLSGSTGSGVLMARLPDGRWSPPSGIRVHTVGAGITYGVDVYDCVCVINTPEALGIFTDTRFTLGPDLALAVGPYGGGGAVAFNGTFPDRRHRGPERTPRCHRHRYHHPRHHFGMHLHKKTGGDEGEAAAAAAVGEQHQTPPGQQVQQSEQQQQLLEQRAEQAEQAERQQDQPLLGQPIEEQREEQRGEAHTNSKATAIEGAMEPIYKSLRQPVYSYIKSRGFYVGLQINGAVITERTDDNAAFYGAPVTVHQILAAQVPMAEQDGAPAPWINAATPLFDALRFVEGPSA